MLFGQRITVWTDHKNPTFKNIEHASDRVIRQRLLLEEYRVDLPADMLSRNEFIHTPNITVDTSKFEVTMHEMYQSTTSPYINTKDMTKNYRLIEKIVSHHTTTSLRNLENTASGQKHHALMVKKKIGYQRHFEYSYSNGTMQIFNTQEQKYWRRVSGQNLLVPNYLKRAKTSRLNAIHAVK